MQRSDDEKWLDLYESLPSFVHESQGMQAFIRTATEKRIRLYQTMSGLKSVTTLFRTVLHVI